MKRKFLYLAAMAAMIGLTACSKPAETASAPASSADKVYTGVLPSADTQGVRYTLLLDFDDDTIGGDYDMVQTYFNSDSTGNIIDVASFALTGDFDVETGAAGEKYLRLSGDGSSAMYFLAPTDTTLIMTGADLRPAETPGMNYTLTAAK